MTIAVNKSAPAFRGHSRKTALVGSLWILDQFGFPHAAGQAEPVHPVGSRAIQFRLRPLPVTDAEFWFTARGAFSVRRMVHVLAMASSGCCDAAQPIPEFTSEAFPAAFSSILKHCRLVHSVFPFGPSPDSRESRSQCRVAIAPSAVRFTGRSLFSAATRWPDKNARPKRRQVSPVAKRKCGVRRCVTLLNLSASVP
jgi:hypothetical protein